MRSAKSWCVCLGVFALALAWAGCPSSGPAPEELCNKMIECGAEGQLSECLTEMQQMKDVLRSSSWAKIGNCMLDLTCAEIETDGSMECLEAAMASGDPNAADGLLRAYCQKMIDCGQAPGYSVQECVELSKSQAGEYLGAYGMFRDSILTCVENCAHSQSCENLEDIFEICMEPCGLIFGSSDQQSTCDHGYEDAGACVCDPGWDGTYCDACAAGYVLDEWDDCVPA
jgi:hypothetical protein